MSDMYRVEHYVIIACQWKRVERIELSERALSGMDWILTRGQCNYV